MYVESQNGILLPCPLQSCNLRLQSELGLRGLSRLFRLGVCRSSWLGRTLGSSRVRNMSRSGMRSQCRLALLCWCRRGYTRHWERVLPAMLQAVGRLRGVRERGNRSISRDASKGRAIRLRRRAWSIAPWRSRRVFGLVYGGAVVHDEAFLVGTRWMKRQYRSRYWRRTASLGEVGIRYRRFCHDWASLMPQRPVRRRLKMNAQKLMASPRQADSIRLRNWAGWRRHRKWAREVSLGSGRQLTNQAQLIAPN